MTITILTLFPEIFTPVFSSSIFGRAQKKQLVKIRLVNIRDFAKDKHHQVDDKPYGGGVGMVMRVDVVAKAIESAKAGKTPQKRTIQDRYCGSSILDRRKEKIVLLDPKGKLFAQTTARRYSKLDHLILVCGHYEGIDERISHFIDEKISIGNYVLTGGEIPAMAIADAVARLIPGVLTKKEATINESFGKEGYLEEPHFTRPPIFKGLKVPEVLLSGDHQKIDYWKRKNRKLLK